MLWKKVRYFYHPSKVFSLCADKRVQRLHWINSLLSVHRKYFKRIDMSESLYSTAEVARLFEINRVTIYRWVQEGVVKAYKVGKHLKIPASEVERLWKEFGFPGASYIHVSDAFRKNRSSDSMSNEVKDEHQKKMLMTVGIGEDDLKYIREIFAGMKLAEEYRLTTYMDTLEAALAIGKEKPDLLLIKVMKLEGNGVEFARKIRSIHSDIKIIFMSDSAINRDEKGEVGSLENVSITVGRKRLHREIIKNLGLHDRN